MVKKEINLFFTALLFYTRIPCPNWVNHDAEKLNKATRYFPLIGWLVGGISALVVWVSSLLFPLEIGILFSMICGIILTGAFHEDGLADVCDGFGGGWTKQKILEIMKDSRIGAFGAIGLFLALLLKYVCLLKLAYLNVYDSCISILIAHSLSRFFAILLRIKLSYVRENDLDGKAKPVAKTTSAKDYTIAFAGGVLPMLFYKNYSVFICLIPLSITVFFLRRYFLKWINGYTGDCLGATQQVCELITYLSILALWKFI